MKNFIKTIIFTLTVIAIGSCEHDPDPIVAANGFALRATNVAPSLVLIPQNDASTAVSLEWDKSDNGGITTVSTYTVEVSESGNTSFSVTANGGNIVPETLSYTFTVQELNALVNKLPGYVCGQEISVDIKVKSTLSAGYYNAFSQFSTNVITVSVTPYSIALPTLAFSATATITDTTPRLASSGVLNTDYEGYMWLEPGMYKFYKPNSCNEYTAPIVYGDDNSGTFNTLAIDGGSYEVLTAAYYLVKANTATTGTGALSYSVRPITWNFFGDAKPTFPLANSPLTYDAASGLWKTTFTLSDGYPFKFRSNLNTFILGSFDATKIGTEYGGTILSYNGGNLLVPGTRTVPRVNSSYDITLDLRSPRNYTYTIILHP